jgi:DnaK suppressor protein
MATSKSRKAGKTAKPVKAAKPAATAKRAKPVVAAKRAAPVKPVKPAVQLRKPVPAPAAPVRPLPRTVKFSDKDLDTFRKELMALRDRLTGQVARMRQDSLKRDDEVNPEEDGTDAFDRLFALERAGNDQDIIFTIDEAIRAIDGGKYGVCDGCGNLIEKPRLHALPFAKNCIKCQSEMERGRSGSAQRRQVP